jgi:hypothetical protein
MSKSVFHILKRTFLRVIRAWNHLLLSCNMDGIIPVPTNEPSQPDKTDSSRISGPRDIMRNRTTREQRRYEEEAERRNKLNTRRTRDEKRQVEDETPQSALREAAEVWTPGHESIKLLNARSDLIQRVSDMCHHKQQLLSRLRFHKSKYRLREIMSLFGINVEDKACGKHPFFWTRLLEDLLYKSSPGGRLHSQYSVHGLLHSPYSVVSKYLGRFYPHQVEFDSLKRMSFVDSGITATHLWKFLGGYALVVDLFELAEPSRFVCLRRSIKFLDEQQEP